MSEYPEHDKLEKVQAASQSIGEFLEWLQGERKIVLAHHIKKDSGEMGRVLHPISINIRELLAEFFKVDLKKLEQENLEILKLIRRKK